MSEFLDPLAIRRRLGRYYWGVPVEFGGDGWRFDHLHDRVRIIVSDGHMLAMGDTRWIHASISRPDRMPEYADLKDLHHAVWGTTGWSYQVFAPAADHVNIHEHVLHLWGRVDGAAVLPNFGANGTI